MKDQEKKFSIVAGFYSEHYEEILGFVSKQLQYADDAEDIVQDIFVRLLRSDKMITPVTMPSLVYTVARNLVCDYWRHRRSVDEYEHYLAFHGASDSLDVASVFSVSEIHELLEQGIARLTGRQRDVYSLNIYEGMQVKDISERLHINYKSAENQLGAARKEVRRYIATMLAS